MTNKKKQDTEVMEELNKTLKNFLGEYRETMAHVRENLKELEQIKKAMRDRNPSIKEK